MIILLFCLFLSGIFIHFIPLVSFHTPWKHQKTRGFFMFSGGIEWDQWHEIGYSKHDKVILASGLYQSPGCCQNLQGFLNQMTEIFQFLNLQVDSFSFIIIDTNFHIWPATNSLFKETHTKVLSPPSPWKSIIGLSEMGFMIIGNGLYFRGLILQVGMGGGWLLFSVFFSVTWTVSFFFELSPNVCNVISRYLFTI